MATTMKKAEILSTAKAGILEKLNLEARGALGDCAELAFKQCHEIVKKEGKE